MRGVTLQRIETGIRHHRLKMPPVLVYRHHSPKSMKRPDHLDCHSSPGMLSSPNLVRPLGQSLLRFVKRHHKIQTLGLTTLLTAFMGMPCSAELPALMEKPWMGQFAVFKNRKYQITVSNQGEIRLAPLGKDGEVIGAYITIPIKFGLEETLPNGKTRLLNILPESLESSDPATDSLEKTIIRGKVTGGAAFEATLEEARGIVTIGGRVTDPGPTKKNPLGFSVLTTIPYFFGHVDKETPAQLKEFETKIKDDYIQVKWTNGKRNKEMFTSTVDAGSPEMNGPGISSAEIGITPFQGKKFLLSASDNSSMRTANSRRATSKTDKAGAPLYEGLLISWTADASKDPQGRARISFQVK